MLLLLALLAATLPGAFASCQCLGNNDGIPKSQTKFYGTAYGTECGAWDQDYNYCSEKNQQEKPQRACWCPGRWCYVDQFCDSAEPSQFSDEVTMHFSYAACGEDKRHCWADDNGSLNEEEYADSDDVVYATRSKKAERVKVMPLGDPETQEWDFCVIDSCQFYGGSAMKSRRRYDLPMEKIPLFNPEMSDVTNNAPAERAIDGHPDKTWWGDGSCIHSGDGPSWWRADFGGKEHAISEVKIYQRRDCCGYRVNNLKIKIGKEVCVKKTKNGGSGHNSFMCEGGTATGEFIEISTSVSAQPLNFCEVEVFGNVADAKSVDSVASTGCKIVSSKKNALGNKIFNVETKPYTAAVVHCLKGKAFKKVRWVDDGNNGRGP